MLMSEKENSIQRCGQWQRKLLDLAATYLLKNSLGIDHTLRVLSIAQKQLNMTNETEELTIVSIILHDVGGETIKEQYEKGPSIAAGLLQQLDYSDKFVRDVCEIIRTHHERLEDPSEAFRILYDADQLVRLSREEFPRYESRGTDWNSMIDKLYFEQSKRLARKMLQERMT